MRRLRRLAGLVLLAVLVLPAAAGAFDRELPYVMQARLLGGMLSFELSGTLVQRVDPASGRFELRASGRGNGIENLIESAGFLANGLWVPESTQLRFVLWGRVYQSEAQFDWGRRLVRYRSRSESFFLRSPRLLDDTLALDPQVHVDDLGSVVVNFADGRWAADPDGKLRTFLVRRSADPEPRPGGGTGYRPELRRLTLEAQGPDERGRVLALVDITGFTSWARPEHPARVVFGPDGRPEQVDLRLRYGTSVRVRFGEAR